MVYQKKMSKSPLKSNPIVNVVPTKSGATVLNQNHEEQVLDPTEMTYLKWHNASLTTVIILEREKSLKEGVV